MVFPPFLADVTTLDWVILSMIIPILFWVWKKPNPPGLGGGGYYGGGGGGCGSSCGSGCGGGCGGGD